VARILVIEDDKNLVKLLEFNLSKAGYDVSSAYDGIEGLHKARTEKPDVIILDIMLPKLDGYKISRLLKGDKKYKDIRILMLTAKTTEKDEELGRGSEADFYMRKPFEIKELLERIEVLLYLDRDKKK
jgi:DNA-binding response OmpR family regulator